MGEEVGVGEVLVMKGVAVDEREGVRMGEGWK